MSDVEPSLLEDHHDGGATIEQLSESLLRYEEPRVRGSVGLGHAVEVLSSPGSPAGSPKRGLIPGEEKQDRPKTVLSAREVLDGLFPPRVWPEGGAEMVQHVSAAPGTSLEVISLQENLELRLNLRSARVSEVCPQREDLHAQCFDELIRQVTVACPERGLLLARVRDEIDMSIDGYQRLLDTVFSLGMRKVIQRNMQHEVQKELGVLEYEVQIQQKRVQSLHAKLAKTKKIIEDKQKLAETLHEDEVRFVKKGNIQLNSELKRLTQAAAQ
ncbi:33 kDa inner dynein arm light chain [Diplonema papillatum]|nr:33 kDa inner dynein arm light chain [Diplonema papillatum]